MVGEEDRGRSRPVGVRQREEAEIYLRKTIALVAFAAVAAAPTAGARIAPVEPYAPGGILLQGTVGQHPKAKTHKQCTRWGPYCVTARY